LESWGRFSFRESPAPILRPHPPKDADEVGVVISQSIVAFSRRKLVTDFQFFWCCRISTNVFRTFSGSCSRDGVLTIFKW
jgi:hypothetical protein